MNFKLFVIRKIKALFSKLKLHFIFKPFENIFLNIAYLSKLSSWISANPKGRFNDFYNSKVVYQDRFKLHEFVIKEEIGNSSIDYLEFGVANGIAIEWWVNRIKNPATIRTMRSAFITLSLSQAFLLYRMA